MKLSGFSDALVSLIALQVVYNPFVSAAPLSDDDSSTLSLIPRINELSTAQALSDGTENWPCGPVDSTFWTGMAPRASVFETFIQQKLDGKGVWLRQVFSLAYQLPYRKSIPDGDLWQFFGRISQAYASLSEGTAWLFIPAGVDENNPYPGEKLANWVAYEVNTLTRNPNIQQIIRVNPDNFDDQKILWKKGEPPIGQVAQTNTPPTLPPEET
jgi:hypothetical protein